MTPLTGINANLLVVLEAVVSERSVGRASRRLGLSQPAVSNQLAKLRAVFGDPLVVRVGSRMELTPRAEAILPRLQEGIRALQSILHDPEMFRPEHSQARFRVAMVDLAEIALLPRLLARLRAEAPRAHLQVFSASVFEVSSGLASGELDVLICIVDTGRLGGGYYEQPLFDSRFEIIARSGHPALDGPLSVEAYAALEHVVVTQKADARGVIDRQPPTTRPVGSWNQ